MLYKGIDDFDHTMDVTKTGGTSESSNSQFSAIVSSDGVSALGTKNSVDGSRKQPRLEVDPLPY